MPNVASVLKSEIARIAKKELRAEIASLKKSQTSFRSDIAALKRANQRLEQAIRTLGKRPEGAERACDDSSVADEDPFQPEVARGAAPTPRLICRGLRQADRRIGAVGLQLGGGQGSATAVPSRTDRGASHAWAQERPRPFGCTSRIPRWHRLRPAERRCATRTRLETWRFAFGSHSAWVDAFIR
jgi:hypothetical protein